MNKYTGKGILPRRFGLSWLAMMLIFSLLISHLGFFQVDVVYADPTYDYGDAPAPYPTTNSAGGPNHETTGPTLGTNRDAETDGLPSSNADGDDIDGAPDDEEQNHSDVFPLFGLPELLCIAKGCTNESVA